MFSDWEKPEFWMVRRNQLFTMTKGKVGQGQRTKAGTSLTYSRNRKKASLVRVQQG